MSNTNNYYDDEIEHLISQLSRKGNQKYIAKAVGSGLFKAKRMQIKRENLVKNQLYTKKHLKNKSIDMCTARVDKMARCESGMGVTDSRQGVEMLSREITSIAERPNYTGDHDLSDATIKEMGWDLSRVVERPTLISSFQWGSASPIGVYLLTNQVPSDLLPIFLTQVPFSQFLYWRGDVVLKLQVAGSPLMQGILAMSFVPLVNNAEMNNLAFELSSLVLNPTVYMYANTNTMAELRIPYNHVQAYLDTKSKDIEGNLGYIAIYVIEPLIALGDVTAVTVSLFSLFENSEFKVPRLSSEAAKLQKVRMAKAESGLLDGALSSLLDIGSGLVSGAVESLTGKAKEKVQRRKRSGMSSVKEEISSKAMPSNFVGDIIDMASPLLEGFLGFMGLDNPTIPIEEHRAIVKANGSMNYSIGPEYIEKLANIPSALSMVTTETFGSITDEMDVSYLYSKYSYMGRFDITKTQVPGSLVYTVPLSPFPTILNEASSLKGPVPVGDIIQNHVWFPLLSYLGLPYRYWTGGLRFKLLVSASSLHTCKLFVAFNYGHLVKPVTLMDAASQYGVAIEICQGSNEFEFSVPYVALTPYKNVCSGDINEYNCMGLLNVFIMNQLVAPSTVSPTIGFAVFIAGSNDFSYEMLGGQNPAIPVFQATNARKVINVYNLASATATDFSDQSVFKCAYAESGVLGAMQTIAPLNVAPTITDVVGEDDDQISPPQVEANVDDHFGVVSISLRSLLKRYECIGQYDMATAGRRDNWVMASFNASTIFQLPGMSIPPITPVTTTLLPDKSPNGILTWAGAMYRQFKGSLRFKIVIDSVGGSGLNPSIYNVSYVYWQPGPSNTLIDKIKDDRLNIYNSGMLPSYGAYNNISGTAKYIYPNCTPSKYTILNGVTSNILEFEMPYSSNYLSTLTFSGANPETIYSGLGTIYVVSSVAKGLNKNMVVYAAFGDETRFGNLYRIPSVYVPAVYVQSEGVVPLVPTWNLGAGTYPLSIGGTRLAHAESGMTSQCGDNPRKRNRRKNGSSYGRWVEGQVKKFVSSNNGCPKAEFYKFLDSLAKTEEMDRKLVQHLSHGNVLRKIGVRFGKDDRVYLTPRVYYGKTKNSGVQTSSPSGKKYSDFGLDL